MKSIASYPIVAKINYTSKIKSFIELLKVRLSGLVVFSGVFGFVLGSDKSIDIEKLIFFSIGGFLMTGASNILNQVFERDLDLLMKRTMNRPLPSHRISIEEAMVFCLFLMLAGFGILVYKVNVNTAFLTFISMVLYAFLYTPMKRISPYCVLIGAFPGALPPLIGWVAATGFLSTGAWILFGLQFVWQFPHFWAIAWVLDEDYKKAGFKMLPSSGGKNYETAFQVMLYTLFLIPIGFLPTIFGLVGIISGIVASVSGICFLYQTFGLLKEGTIQAARRIMFASFIYLPVVQITFMLDKV